MHSVGDHVLSMVATTARPRDLAPPISPALPLDVLVGRPHRAMLNRIYHNEHGEQSMTHEIPKDQPTPRLSQGRFRLQPSLAAPHDTRKQHRLPGRLIGVAWRPFWFSLSSPMAGFGIPLVLCCRLGGQCLGQASHLVPGGRAVLSTAASRQLPIPRSHRLWNNPGRASRGIHVARTQTTGSLCPHPPPTGCSQLGLCSNQRPTDVLPDQFTSSTAASLCATFSFNLVRSSRLLAQDLSP
ncbi:hypothetical protein VTK26DRAFT_6856 [Humicola hyalothermophila]